MSLPPVILATGFYLVASYNRSQYHGHDRALSVRVCKTAPSLAKDEIAIHCSLKLPKALFDRPALSARIEVPQEAVPQTEISMELASNIEELIQQHLGISMTVGVEETDD